MHLLYKSNIEEPQEVGDTNFKQFYPQINKNMDWSEVAHGIKQATEDYVIPYITPELYAYISEKYHEDTATLNEHELVLLEKLQNCIAEYTVWSMSPRLNITISDFGIREESGSNGTSNPAQQWRYKHGMWRIMVDADKHLDTILTLLEKSQAHFSVWQAHRAQLFLDNSFLRNTGDVQQHIDIGGSPRTFTKLQPHILRVQRTKIKTLLGAEQYQVLLSKIRLGEDLTEAEQGLLSIVGECTALHAFVRALPSLQCLVEGGAVFVISDMDGMNTKQTAHFSVIEALKNQAEEDAQAAETHLLAYLYENEEDLPVWAASQAKEDSDSFEGHPKIYGAGGLFL